MPKAFAQEDSQPVSGAAERGRIVRRQLLAAAAQLIPEVGWTGVSTRSVAGRAGLAPGLVHYHFESLQALLRSAAIDAISTVLAAAEPAVKQASTAQQGMAVLLGALDTHTGSDPMSMLFIETYLAASRDDVLRGDLTRMLTEFRWVLAGWMRELGQEAPEETAAVVAAAIDGVMLHRALDPTLTSEVVVPVFSRLLGVSASSRVGAQQEGET